MSSQETAREADGNGVDGSFDGRMGRLEEIVAALESGGLELEPSIEKYKEGVALLRDCQELLGRYRKQVEELSRDAAGALRPYAQDPDLAGGEGEFS